MGKDNDNILMKVKYIESNNKIIGLNVVVLMAGCEVPVLCPPINIFYMMKALRDFGFYD